MTRHQRRPLEHSQKKWRVQCRSGSRERLPKYSTPDRVILFSFYNHPQLLWVWADKTSISPKKRNLHVDVWERGKASIKGGGSSQKDGGRSSPGPLNPKAKRIIRTLSSSDEVQGPKPLRPCREKVLLDTLGSPLCNYCEHHDQPQSSDQGLTFQPTLNKFIVWAFYVRTQ